MTESLYSNSWYRVAALKPRLGAHAHIFRQIYRGQLWYVLQDRASGRYNRFTPAAYLAISLMNGQRTVQEIWDTACVELGANVPTQDDIVHLLAQLHQTDALHADVTPNIARVSDRVRKVRWRKILLSMANPMAIRIPLLDPDRFLNATMPILRPLYSWPAVLALLVFVGYSFLVAASHWREIAADIADHVLAAESLLLMLATYPFVKALHELGHAYAVKRWGGEVHEIGIMFLVFTPVPYVDASASSSFPQKWRRAFVAMAGIAVELVLAGIALQVWLNTGEGLFRAFAFNVMFIGGVSTLLINGNPLLRFDGYYALSDIIEVPNLAIRANRYIGYLIQRYGFGVRTVESPVAARGEAAWLVCYAVASFVYRLTVVLSITLFVASRYFVVGVILAIWGVVMMIVVPIGKQVNFLFTSPVLRERRRRAFGITGAVLAAIVAFLLWVPLPYSTIAAGVMWVPGDAIVHARTEGTVVRLLQAPESHVTTGEPILQLEDPLLEAKVRAQEAKTEGLRLRFVAASVKDPAEAQIAAQALRHAEADLDLLRQHQKDLLVLSPNHGRFVVLQPNDLIGGFARQGDTLGYVLRSDFASVLVIVDEESADLVRNQNVGVELRLAHKPEEVLWGIVVREVPMFTDKLPSMALSTAGGGEVAMDPTDAQHARALVKMLVFEIGLSGDELREHAFGERVFVRFRHENEALAFRLYRMARQLVMSRLNV
jgi:putative peptide zinc metalloprotease protein